MAFNTQSRRSLTSDAISRSYRRRFICDNESDIASLVSKLRLCVLNAAPFENRWWRLTANQGTGFTDEMRMHIAWDISPSPTFKWNEILKEWLTTLTTLFQFPSSGLICSLYHISHTSHTSLPPPRALVFLFFTLWLVWGCCTLPLSAFVFSFLRWLVCYGNGQNCLLYML